MKTEQPPKINKEEEFNNLAVNRFIENFKFDVNYFIKNGLDKEGNIKNISTLFIDFFEKELKEEFGKDNFEKIDFNYWYWKIGDLQKNFVDNLKDRKIKNDLEKIISIKFCEEIFHHSLNDFSDSFGYVDKNILDNLRDIFLDKNTTILEKSFIKDALISGSSILEMNTSANYLKNFKKEINIEFNSFEANKYHDLSLNKIKFDIKNEQKERILEDLEGQTKGEKIEPISKEYIEWEKLLPLDRGLYEYDGKENVGNYLNSYIAPGIVGVYSIKGNLIGWKKLEEENDYNKKYELNNIIDIKNESNLKKEEFALFKLCSSLVFRDHIKNIFNIDLSKLNLNNQYYFLNFIQNKKEDDVKRFKNFLEKSNKEEDKINKLKSFLSIEHGGKEMGDKILELGEKLPKKSAEILFKTYSQMIDATDEIETLLRENLGEKATPELINEAKESLLFGAKDLLEKYAKKANTCQGIECETLGQELEERLSLAQKSIFAFSYACKTLVEKGEFSFEDFKKAKLTFDKSPLPEEMQNKIIAIHEENTKQYPEKLKNLWRGTLRDGLKNKNPDQLIVSVSYEDEIVSAMRVIKRPDGSWYGASFNVNPTVQGSRVGTELQREVLENLAKDKPFVADCYSKNPMLDNYLNKFGFKITKEMENYHNTGELVYEITIFPKKLE